MRNLPEEWVFEDAIEKPTIYNTQIREIIEEGSTVRLRMNRSTELANKMLK